MFVFFGPIGKTRWPPWPLIGWDIFDFSFETAERNSFILGRKQDLNVHYQVCVFRADRKNKMAAPASDWLRHFRLPLKPLNEIQRNLTGSKISMSSTKFVFFGPIGKTRWLPRPLIGWDIFDFLWNRWTKFNETWQEARSQCPLPSLCFSGRSEKQDGCPGLWLAETFSTSSETAERNSTKLDRKQDLNVFYQVYVFGADIKNKIATLAFDWLRHFWLLLWKEFNETFWQEAKSQRPLPCLYFSGWSVNKYWCPGWFLKKVAHYTQVQDMWPFGPLVYCSTVMWVNGVTSFKQKPIENEDITFTWKFYNFAIFWAICRINVTCGNSFSTSFLLFNSYVVNGVTSFKQKPMENKDITITWKFYVIYFEPFVG